MIEENMAKQLEWGHEAPFFTSGYDPITGTFPMSKVNDALEHLRSGKARYRIVLVNDRT